MASAHKIRMDFELAKRQAQRLEEVAGKMDRIADGQTADAMERLAAGWTGENSVKFIKKESRLQSEMGSTADSLRRVADTIREIAQNVYEAEMEAYEIARDRRSK